MMLAALGMFIFDTDTTLFDELSRRRSWRHGRTERFGARAASQYLGPGEDQVTLSGKSPINYMSLATSLYHIALMKRVITSSLCKQG